MTEILEQDGTEDLEPDHWAGVFRFYDPRPQQELERLTAEFFQRGGVATWIPPKEMEKERLYYDYYAAPIQDEREAERAKRRIARKRAEDAPKVALIDRWLAEMPVTSRRKMAASLEMSEQLVARLLGAHFADDPRAEPYQRTDIETMQSAQDKEDEKNRDLIQSWLSRGVCGVGPLVEATGLSYNVFSRVARKYGLKVRKPTREEVIAEAQRRSMQS